MKLLVLPEKSKQEKRKSLILLAASVAIGFLNGFFGGGGGMLAVPALRYIKRLPEKESHATAIAVMLPLSVLSGTLYVLRGALPVFDAGMVVIGVLSGGILGAALLAKLSGAVVSAVFYGVMIAAGIRMLF